jgi:creatinine amidohydrolase
MPRSSRSCLLTELSWADVEQHLARDSRLIVPVGACDQFGPHLPIGAGTLVAEAVADELARDFGVLRAPTLHYGVNVPAARRYAGTAGLSEKTLHRALNDLLADWEDHGFSEFILITAHRYDPHVEAIATVTGTRARVRAVEALGVNLADLLDGHAGVQHGGEVITSLMLYLYPDRVNLSRAADFRADGGSAPHRRIGRLPRESPGSVGEPSLATAAKGERIYARILQKIRTRVFLEPEEPEEG